MAETNTYLDPNQFEAQKRAEYGSQEPTFTPTPAAYQQTATAEIAPYYSTFLSGLDVEQAKGEKKISQTYDDLLKNLKEGYNQRGTFFSGEAIGAEQKAQEARAEAITGLSSDISMRRAEAGLEQTGRVNARASQLQEQAYQDYLTAKQQNIDKKVYTDLATYLPKYAEFVQQQTTDANSPWLDLPIDGDVGSAEPAAAVAPAADKIWNDPPAVRDTKQEKRSVGLFGAIFGRLPQSQTDWNFTQVANWGYTGKRDSAKEKQALSIYKKIFKKAPETKYDKNLVDAIAYAPIS